jgi:hypothetical protein
MDTIGCNEGATCSSIHERRLITEAKGENVQSLVIRSRRGLLWIKESPKKSDVKLHRHLSNVNIRFTKRYDNRIPELPSNQPVSLTLADDERALLVS